jgi:oxygen-independent coproporphyrinogen III oxidase
MLQGLYIHIPFCPQICPYCAFASLRGEDHMHERYIAALCREIDKSASLRSSEPLRTVFFGGGTPTQVAPELLGRVLETIARTFAIAADAEITVEANPGTVDLQKFAGLRRIGCNRLSLGVQSFDDGALKKLGRVHDSAEAARAFGAAREAGFENASIDLIFSVPGVAPATWRASVEKAVELAPEHISAYALSIEEGTVFAQRHREGRLLPRRGGRCRAIRVDSHALIRGWLRAV